MRGKVRMYEGKLAMDRITPAYAGKRCGMRLHNYGGKDHPRLCGEKITNCNNFTTSWGSPPPMRGKANRSTIFCTLCGITPAYAGKRTMATAKLLLHQDHPRLCGEKGEKRAETLLNQGSPPPMRGKVDASVSDENKKRDHPRLCGEKLLFVIDEAQVLGSPPPMRGKDILTILLKLQRQDHPRLCGEKGTPLSQRPLTLGSPPPMRGKAVISVNRFVVIGITPAYAGKRSILYDAIDTMRDHPRLCGEKAKQSICFAVDTGSPPPMRGKGPTAVSQVVGSRITPAYAGKSLTCWNCYICTWDHPRLCGEKG